MAMVEPADINVDELRRRARRRLVGAVVLALGVAVVVPMLLETEQKPLGEDVSVKIPPIDDGKFVNRLAENRAKDDTKDAAPPTSAPPSSPTPSSPTPSSPTPSSPTPSSSASPSPASTPASSPASTPKYDTRLPDEAAPPASTAPATSGGEVARNATAGTTPGKAPVAPDRIAAQRPATAPSAPRSEAKPASAAPAPAPAPESPAAGSAAPPHEGFAVQLAAFADDKGANALAGRLKKSGYAAYTEPLKTSKGTLWRVRVGPYPSREAATTARDKLKSEGQSGIVAAIK